MRNYLWLVLFSFLLFGCSTDVSLTNNELEEFEQYKEDVGPPLILLQSEVEYLGDLLIEGGNNPDVYYNQSWQTDVTTSMESIIRYSNDIQGVRYPKFLESEHEVLLESSSGYKSATGILATALLTLEDRHLEACGVELERAYSLMNEYLNAFKDFSEQIY